MTGKRMRVLDLLALLRARLRGRAIRAQDTCAVLGLAVGVALLFASQIASTSLANSVSQLTREVVGRTQWQLSARGPNGMSEALLTEVRRLPVRLALPLIEEPGVATGPNGERSIELLGSDPREAQLAGTALARLTATQVAHTEGVALPATLAGELGVESLEPIKLQLGGTTTPVSVGTLLGQHQIGGLINSPLVFAPIAYAQQWTHMQGRLSRIFVAALPGRQAAVRAGLAQIATANDLNLEPSDWESKLFATAFSPDDQSETVFSVIAAIVGFLLAANAILITVPSRRLLLEDLRLAGATPGKQLKIMLFDAAVIGMCACVVGVVLGDLLSRTLFAGSPGYLSFAFPVGNARIVSWQSVLISVAAGLIASVAGMLWPLRDIVARHTLVRRWSVRLPRLVWQLGGGTLFMVLALVILFAKPALASLGALSLLVAMICWLQPLYELVIAVFGALQRRFGGWASWQAIQQLGSPMTRVRSLAIAAIAAAAVFGVLALAGAQSNLRRGLDRSAREIDSGAQIWITAAGQSNAFATTPIHGTTTLASSLSRVPGVQSVSEYGGAFLNWGSRRLWVLAPPRTTAHPIPVSQLVSGSMSAAVAEMRNGDGVLVSQALAEEHHLEVGHTFVLPSPSSLRVRLAGLITNLGWPPGALVMSAANYVRAWNGIPPSAIQVDARPNMSIPALGRRIERVVAGTSGLRVETVMQRERRHEALASQGLERLTQIRVLVIIAAALAIAGALGTLLWQHRGRLANMRVLGANRRLQWRALCYESAMLLAAGCIIGTIFGFVGQVMLSHALRSVTGFPIAFNLEIAALADCALIVAAAGIVVVGIGYRAASVPASTANAAT